MSANIGWLFAVLAVVLLVVSIISGGRRSPPLVLALITLPVLGCHREGPTEEVGRKIDEAVDDLRD